MTARHLMVACALIVATADATNGQTTFAYRWDAPASFKFVSADTIVTNMDTPMGAMTTKMGMAGNYNISVTPGPDSTQVKLEIGSLTGTMEAMGQSMPLPTPDFPPVEFKVGPRGSAQNQGISGAAVGGAGQMGPGSMISRMFLRLPEGPVRIGATWTDTLNETMDTAGIKMTMNGRTTSTYVSDTTVDGRRMHRLRMVTDGVLKGNVDTGGQQMTQNMKLNSTSDVLWDPQRRIFVAVDTEGTMTGTMEMAGMGTMNMTATTKNRLKIAN
jgi:hypothetical protein